MLFKREGGREGGREGRKEGGRRGRKGGTKVGPWLQQGGIKAWLRHGHSTRKRMLAPTHGLHDMCGMQHVAVRAQSVVQPLLSLVLAQGCSTWCIKVAQWAMGTMPWHVAALRKVLDRAWWCCNNKANLDAWLMRCTRVQCPVHGNDKPWVQCHNSLLQIRETRTQHGVLLQQLDCGRHGGAWLTCARPSLALQQVGPWHGQQPIVPWAPWHGIGLGTSVWGKAY